MRRVPEVLEVWYDSGAMPFAQQGYPHQTDDLAGVFPADYICEALDQTRGWFYSLLAESTLLFDETSFRNVVCLGLILDGDGQKMSKSKGNVIEPWTVIERQGADAFRWYLFTAQSAGESFRFNLEAVDEAGIADPVRLAVFRADLLAVACRLPLAPLPGWRAPVRTGSRGHLG